MTNVMESILDTRIYTRTKVLGCPCPSTEAAGVYGWWFREIPKQIETGQCQQRDGLTLVVHRYQPVAFAGQ